MSGERGDHDHRPGPPDPGWASVPDPAAYPRTEVLPQQLATPPYGVPVHEPASASRQNALVAGLATVVLAALLFFLLVVFGVFGDDSSTVDTVDGTPEPTVDIAARVPAVAQTIFRCPEGSRGQPSVEDPNCIVAESNQLVDAIARETTTYRCPAGSSGSPNAARPVCAATASGSVPAITTTTLRCPQGSTGTPTASNPVCRAVDQQVRVPVEAVVVYECADDERLDEAADPPQCVAMVEERRTVDAVEDITFECPPDLDVDPPPTADECRRELVGEPSCPTPNRLEGDGSGRNESVWVCLGELVTEVDADEQCPLDSAPDPDRPSRTGAIDCYATSSACSAGRYEESTEDCVRSAIEQAVAIVSQVCPEDIDALDGTVVGDRCEYTGVVEARVPATETTAYRCPEGARGQGGSPDAICVADRDVDVAALASTSYSCPAGSTGSPTGDSPTCTSTTMETVPAIVEAETVYECPEGTVGEPTADDPKCARSTGAVTVPASVVTEFSCPAGATGTPTFTDPFCQAVESE